MRDVIFWANQHRRLYPLDIFGWEISIRNQYLWCENGMTNDEWQQQQQEYVMPHLVYKKIACTMWLNEKMNDIFLRSIDCNHCVTLHLYKYKYIGNYQLESLKHFNEVTTGKKQNGPKMRWEENFLAIFPLVHLTHLLVWPSNYCNNKWVTGARYCKFFFGFWYSICRTNLTINHESFGFTVLFAIYASDKCVLFAALCHHFINSRLLL